MIWIDRKYLSEVSSRLGLFKTKSQDLYNFRCPYCGDSKRIKNKARGYIYRKGNDYFFKCHNCGAGTTFARFLKHLDHAIFDQYCLERWNSGASKYGNFPKPDTQKSQETDLVNSPKECLLDELLERVDLLPENHPAKVYLTRRLVPTNKFNRIYFIDDTRKFEQLSEKYKDKITDKEPRLVFPFLDKTGKLIGLSARSLTEKGIRYVNIKVADGPTVFGLFHLDFNQHVYVTEGAIDSLFLPNAIAVAGAGLNSFTAGISRDGFTLLWDNEPRNPNICKLMSKAIDNENRICIWPENLLGKDINEMVILGQTPEKVLSTIQDNTFSGLKARMRFNFWKRC